jgi:hypothetical protein
MKTKEIYVSIKFTKNIGNYQSFTAEAGITVEVEQGDITDDVFANTWKTAKEQVSNQIKSLKTGGSLND